MTSSSKAARTRRFTVSSAPKRPKFVMAAADVLDECVPGGDYSCAAELFEPAHRSQSGLQPSVIGFDRVVSVLLGGMTGGRHQLIEPPRVGSGTISGDLDRGRRVIKGAGEESTGGPPGPASRRPEHR
jgi:hypothetical protein